MQASNLGRGPWSYNLDLGLFPTLLPADVTRCGLRQTPLDNQKWITAVPGSRQLRVAVLVWRIFRRCELVVSAWYDTDKAALELPETDAGVKLEDNGEHVGLGDAPDTKDKKKSKRSKPVNVVIQTLS